MDKQDKLAATLAATRRKRHNRGQAKAMRTLASFIGGMSEATFYSNSLYGYVSDEDSIRALMARSPGGWEKDVQAGCIYYTKHLDNDAYIIFSVSRPECKQVQTGTKRVEAHDEPVYEWQCPEDNNSDSAGSI